MAGSVLSLIVTTGTVLEVSLGGLLEPLEITFTVILSSCHNQMSGCEKACTIVLPYIMCNNNS